MKLHRRTLRRIILSEIKRITENELPEEVLGAAAADGVSKHLENAPVDLELPYMKNHKISFNVKKSGRVRIRFIPYGPPEGFRTRYISILDDKGEAVTGMRNLKEPANNFVDVNFPNSGEYFVMGHNNKR